MIAALDDRGHPTHEFLMAAERYASQGLRILPLEPKQKKPLGRLVPRGVHDATDDLGTIREYWTLAPDANIGIATGPASDVIAIDVDPRNGGDDSLNALEAQYGPFPDTCVVVTGRDDGKHYYFRYPKFNVRNNEIRPGIEIKSRGVYVVAPPSIHPDTGNKYRGDIDVNFIACPPPWLLSLIRINRETETQSNGATEKPTIASVPPSLCLSVNEAIQATLPNCEGQRNRKIFEFIRHLKAKPEFAGASADGLRNHVETWHRLALPYISTKSFDITWADFVYAWPKVNFAVGTNPVQAAWHRAQLGAKNFSESKYDDPRLRTLQAFCFELQIMSGANSFFLSCRDAGKLLEIDHVSAAKLLNLLVHDKILVITTRGTATRATRYRYTGPNAVNVPARTGEHI